MLNGYSTGSAITGGTLFTTIADLTAYGIPLHLHFAIYHAAYTAYSWRGALPTTNCGGNPAFPDQFTNPTTYIQNHMQAANPTPLLVDNGTYTFVANNIHLRKYSDGRTGTGFLSGSDTTGLTGPYCPNYSASLSCMGYEDMGATITGLAINSSVLYIGLSIGRVIKTNMCGTGGNVCAFSDSIGSGPYPGYSYWIGEQDLSIGSVTALAVNSNYLYMSFGTRTVKTTLCGTGGNMCALNSDGTGSIAGYNYWVGYQNWVWPVVAQGANDNYVFTSLSGSGINRVCKTDLGSTGGDVFWLWPDPADCSGFYTGHPAGYQDMSVQVAGLSVDQVYVWWSLGSAAYPRLIQTDICNNTTGSNVCFFSDGYGSGSLSGYSNWRGRQDWCSGYSGASVTSWNFQDRGTHSSVDISFALGSGTWRIVKALQYGGGVNMFQVDCTGTVPSGSDWQGYQDFTI